MSTQAERYGIPEDTRARERLALVLAQCYGVAPSEALQWFEAAGLDQVRCLEGGGEPIAGLLRVPMGQFWGEASVPLLGIAGVGVAPQARGRGVAARLMLAVLREARSAGFPLAVLYPTTQTLYRAVGFEQAGARWHVTGPLAAVAHSDRCMPVQPFTDDRLPEVRSLETRFASTRQGWLDRGPYIWKRVQQPRGTNSYGYVVGEPRVCPTTFDRHIRSLPSRNQARERPGPLAVEGRHRAVTKPWPARRTVLGCRAPAHA